jgi:TPR repeat protein
MACHGFAARLCRPPRFGRYAPSSLRPAQPRKTNGQGIYRKDVALTDFWCDRAIQLGHVRAAYHLGRYLLEGEHLPQNLALAEKWLLRAANAGDGFAQMLLGVEYESGERFSKNIELAKHWYKNPAEEGRWLAAHNLARLLEIDSSYGQAISLYKKAAYGGYKPSQQRLDELGIDWKTT